MQSSHEIRTFRHQGLLYYVGGKVPGMGMWDFLYNNAFGVFSLLAGLVISYIFYRRGERFKALSSAHLSGFLFSGRGAGDLSKLEIYYDGRAINNIARTRLCIWNSGNEVIDDDVFVQSAPLSIVPVVEADAQVQILDCKTQVVSREASACNATISADRSQILVEFEYLEPKDGFVIDIIHTQNARFELDGELKGVKFSRHSTSVHQWSGLRATGVISRRFLNNPSTLKMLDSIFYVYAFLLPVSFGLLSYVVLRTSGACQQIAPSCTIPVVKGSGLLALVSRFPPILGWIVSILLAVMCLILLVGILAIVFKKRIPKELFKAFPT